jgi:hypothetical protein
MYYDWAMRTTLDLDPDVLAAVKELATLRRTTAGRMMSELVRLALQPTGDEEVKNGVPLLPARPGAGLVTAEHVRRLFDEEP